MPRFKGSILNEPEFWLMLLGIPPQALGRKVPGPAGACVQHRIDPSRADGRSDDAPVDHLARDAGFKCKV
jgi:hypothetical protein